MQHHRHATQRRLALARLAVVIGLCSSAWAQPAPALTTEDELAATSVPAAIDALWQTGSDAGFNGAGGLRIAGRRFVQADRSAEQGAMVIVSGRTETMQKYAEVVFDLWRNGWSVYLHDHRGQGLSAREPQTASTPQKGHVNNFDDYVADLRQFIGSQVLPGGHRRVVLLAHSMGGGITARFLQSGAPELKRIQAAVLTSPMLQIKGLMGLPADVLSCRLARGAVAFGMAGNFFIGGGGHKPPDPAKNPYSQSTARTQRLIDLGTRQPEAVLGSPTWGWLAQACGAAKAAREQAHTISTPVLVMVAGADGIVHNPGAEAFCRQLRRGPLAAGCGGPGGAPLVVPGAKHEMLIERDDLRSQALGQALAFFARH